MTSIKIPKEVWNLIIDKIEPEPFKMPEYIYTGYEIVKFDNIVKFYGPEITSQGHRFRLYDNTTSASEIIIYSHRSPGLFEKLRAFMKHYIKESEDTQHANVKNESE